MNGKDRVPASPTAVLVNLQKRYVVRTASVAGFVRSLQARLRLRNRELNICFVDDDAIRQLNSAFRGKSKPTDVLSFPWNAASGRRDTKAGATSCHPECREFANFLGDVVISVEMARRNAQQEGHSTLNEIRWLILHGVLHLLGYDHSCDTGEMVALELSLREQLGIAGTRARPGKRVNGRRRKSTMVLSS